jgi:hypothetical protein
MHFHKLDRARDRNFWSVRVNQDLRLIVHRAPGSLLLCYVDHHDAAYAWAEPSRQGSLDAPHVRDHAVRIPVGDREAFLQRREKYGY